ncbi:ATP-binding protein [Gordonia hankookensis]|uniref:Anti-sigma factor n=1 Tax=Gordonia hankookensis TaxID=589403 RepID=A0ABR7WIA9_9ACTN|nr:anti-sigma factor [Gordonia hankookensis]MBD1322503.1 anti-sigma factor [Gordonia hankookensis]
MTENRNITDDRRVIDDVAQSADVPVELTVPARADRLQIVRAVVERTLYAVDWTIDDVADIQLAVDEVCSQLIVASVDDGRLRVSLLLGDAGFVGEVVGTIETGIALDTAGFGWHVVETVTDAQSVSYVDDARRREVTVRLAKLLSGTRPR